MEKPKFETAVTEETPKVKTFLQGFLSRTPHNEADISDLVQETFLKAWENWERFNPETTRLSTWVCTLAKGVAAEFQRKKQKDVVDLGMD